MQSFKRRWRGLTPRSSKVAHQGSRGHMHASADDVAPPSTNNPLSATTSPFFRYEIPCEPPRCDPGPPSGTCFRHKASQPEHISSSQPNRSSGAFFRSEIPSRSPSPRRSVPSTSRAFFRYQVPERLVSSMQPHPRATVDRAHTEPFQLEPFFDTDPDLELIFDPETGTRSVFILPAYSPSAGEDEQVIGREGERGGVDVLLEQPETAEEEEARRELEMATLYQIRVQRRREMADVAERREQRRIARDRGDTAELIRLSHITAYRLAEREMYGTTAMIRALRSTSYERRVGSVSYADLGVVRHDGTRVRTDSVSSMQHASAPEYSALHLPGTTTPSTGRERNPSMVSVLSGSYPNSVHGSTGSGCEQRSSLTSLSGSDEAPPYYETALKFNSTPPAYESVAFSRERTDTRSHLLPSSDWRSSMGMATSTSRSRVAPVM